MAIGEPALELIVAGIGRDLGLPDVMGRAKRGDRILGRSDIAGDLSDTKIRGRQPATERRIVGPLAHKALVVAEGVFE